MLNSGKGFSDEFEIECVRFNESQASQQGQGQSKVNQIKREGGAIVKAVKSKVSNVLLMHPVLISK